MADQETAVPGGLDHGPSHHPTGWRRWLFSTNHKDIGTMYIVLSMVGAFAGGAFSFWIRLELMDPGIQFNIFGAGEEAAYFRC